MLFRDKVIPINRHRSLQWHPGNYPPPLGRFNPPSRLLKQPARLGIIEARRENRPVGPVFIGCMKYRYVYKARPRPPIHLLLPYYLPSHHHQQWLHSQLL